MLPVFAPTALMRAAATIAGESASSFGLFSNFREGIVNTPFAMGLALIMAIVILIAAVILIVQGILMFVNGKFATTKAFAIPLIVVSVLAIIGAICAFAHAGADGWSLIINAGAAPIMWIIFGVLGVIGAIVTPILLKKFGKDEATTT